MSAINYTVDDIFDQLDQEAVLHSRPQGPQGSETYDQWMKWHARQNIVFPSLNLNVDLGDVRLTAWRDDRRWAVVIETLVFDMRGCGHGGIQNAVFYFGNCVTPTTNSGKTNINIIGVTADGPEGPTFFDDEHWRIRPTARSIRIRRHVVPINLSAGALRAKGIYLNPDEDGIEPSGGTLLLRSLLPECRDLLLATPEELRAIVPGDLSQFIRLHEWNHPDIGAGDIPSHSETFDLLAKAIVAGDPGVYLPTRPPNTHWTNWKQNIV